jgi:LacI family sucrose operon transcriptional repressor
MRLKRILEEEDIDSLFCTDDLTAILVYNLCQELRRAIPEELKLIGYDGTRFIQNYFPQLTTIGQPIDELAELLVELLIQRITYPDKQLESAYKLPVKVLPSQTT